MNNRRSFLISLGISVALIAAGIWFLWNSQISFNSRRGWMMTDQMIRGGDNGMGVVMVLFWLAVLFAVGLVVAGVTSIRHSPDGSGNETDSDALEILKKRYARGEINETRFKAMKHDLFL